MPSPENVKLVHAMYIQMYINVEDAYIAVHGS